MKRAGRRRRHRRGNHQRRVPAEPHRVPRPRRALRGRPRHRPGQSASGRVRRPGVGDGGRTPCARGHRDRGEPDDPRRARGSRPPDPASGQACVEREARRTGPRERPGAAGRGEADGACGSRARRTPCSARASRPACGPSRTAGSASRSPLWRSCSLPAPSHGTRARSSSSMRAAGPLFDIGPYYLTDPCPRLRSGAPRQRDLVAVARHARDRFGSTRRNPVPGERAHRAQRTARVRGRRERGGLVQFRVPPGAGRPPGGHRHLGHARAPRPERLRRRLAALAGRGRAGRDRTRRTRIRQRRRRARPRPRHPIGNQTNGPPPPSPSTCSTSWSRSPKPRRQGASSNRRAPQPDPMPFLTNGIPRLAHSDHHRDDTIRLRL